jgi:hypothetical protein
MMHDDDRVPAHEPLCFEGGKPVDVASLVGYLTLLAEGKDIDPDRLSKQIGKSIKNNNISRGIDLLQGMRHNEGVKAQEFLDRLIGFAQGTYPTPEYDKYNLRNDFEKVTGISVADSPAKTNSFDDLLDQLCFMYNAGQLRGLDR